MDINTLTLTELKALAFDEIKKLEIAQGNIRILNDQIAKKEKESEASNITPKEAV